MCSSDPQLALALAFRKLPVAFSLRYSRFVICQQPTPHRNISEANDMSLVAGSGEELGRWRTFCATPARRARLRTRTLPSATIADSPSTFRARVPSWPPSPSPPRRHRLGEAVIFLDISTRVSAADLRARQPLMSLQPINPTGCYPNRKPPARIFQTAR
jgi:hypothetical protein